MIQRAEPGDDRTKEPLPIVSIELFEDADWDDPDRLLGTFSLTINRGGDQFDDGDEGIADGAPNFEDIDEEQYWDAATDDYDWEALEARQAELERAADAAAEAHPHRRLQVDDALAVARAFGVPVTVWLDDRWDASDPPREGEPTWPPPDLDLRPRWHYEPPNSTRADAWWIAFSVEAHRLTPEIARMAAENVPHVITVRKSEAAKPAERASSWRRQPSWDRTTQGVELECLIEASSEVAATDASRLMDQITARVPRDYAWPSPLHGKLRYWADLLRLRRPRSPSWSPYTTGISIGVIGPASDAAMTRAREANAPT